MSKLTLKDIKIKGEGPQIKEFILQRYNSLEEFYEKHNEIAKKYTTLLTYLSRDVIVSDSFRCRITYIFNVDYPSLFANKQKQIKNHVINIYNNIKLYDQEADQKIFDYLLRQCIEENMQTEIAMMYRAKARNYYNTNRIVHGIEYYEYAIEALEKDQINKIVLFNSELADYLLRENSIEKADNRYKHIGKLVKLHKDRLSDDTLFLYYYRRGLVYMQKREYSVAREFFTEAVTYSTDNRAKSGAIANIGLTYKKIRKYDEALEYYFDALNYPDTSYILTIAAVYNNIAEAYRCKKDYTNSLKYIEKALKISEKEDNLGKHLMYIETKAEINTRMGEKEAYKSFFDLLLTSQHRKISKLDILSAIKISIENINNVSCLYKLIDIIIDINKLSTSDDYNRGLAECAGVALFKIKELTRRVYREKIK